MYGLQRLCYGQLRPIEIEQLYEKGWFAVTETCLAMTIFREEVGPWFLVMFVALITGKVWGWIGDGRVEILEQQPPPNPRLFHFRLSVSLTISVLYDIWMMSYTISTVIQQARPNMMVMFLFEFTILTTSSVSTAIRYLLSLHEARVVKQQTKERLAERRRELREERAEMIRQREEAAASGEEHDTQSQEPLPSEDDVEEMDIEVPGWETKGQWILTLDLITDFAKLSIYLTFFFILLLFYGIPIHIMRDLFMTTRSFLKRLTAFLRYRRATQDMNKRYGDATVEDIEREDTCIICREQMRPWSVTNPPEAPAAPGEAAQVRPARPSAIVNERSRPKKLPCGHILHLGCLKSWLERQQVCPTCRRPVVENAQATRNATNNANQAPHGAQPPAGDQPEGAGPEPGPAEAAARRRMRILNLGPFRLGFGQANIQDLAAIGRDQPAEDNAARVYGLELGLGRRQQARQTQAHRHANTSNQASVQDRLQQIEQHIMTEIRGLQVMDQELQLVRLLQAELMRLRSLQAGAADPLATNMQAQVGVTGPWHAPPSNVSHLQRHGARGDTLPIPAGSADLPPGVTIPEGWSLLPLQRLNGPGTGQPGMNSIPTARPVPTPASTQHNTNWAPHTSSLPRNHSLRTNVEAISQASSSNSSDANAIHTPSSTSADPPRPPDLPVLPPTLPNRILTANTPTVPNGSDPQALPDWGSSQLFSNLRQTTDATSERESLQHGLNNSTSTAPMNAGISSSIARQDTEQDSAALRRETGKTRAATVEDTIDDAD